MTQQDRMNALMLIEKTVCTVELNPCINGFIDHDTLGITDCCHNTINLLLENGYRLSCKNGRIIVDKS